MYRLSHKEDIILGSDEEIYEVRGRADGMGKVDDWASVGQPAKLFGAGFWNGVFCKDRSWKWVGNQV